MATETITKLVDDLSGGPAERTLTFALEGQSYAIDLNKKNIAGFERALRPYLQAARAINEPRRSNRSPQRGSKNSPDLAAIRSWARENGYEVSDRGRLAADVIAAYRART
jgi:nucleoid-associated protein Lsr2